MRSGVLQHEEPGVLAVPGAEPVPGYRLVRRLGAGGFGEVWSAEGPGGFPVALKIIRLEATRSAAHLRGLEIARTIRHPNLLAGFGAWIDDERLILAMELADASLWDRFLQAWDAGLGGIPREELVEALIEASKGIDYLNEPRHTVGGRSGLGIQHRDLKPQNILLVGGGVKVADFGAARWMEDSVTGHTGLQWTPAYAAPEFFLGATSRYSDQYSLAVTYCHLRTGRLPFTGDPAYVMAGHLMREPDLSMLAGVERPVVARALAKNPEERWPSCRAFAEALRSCVSAAPARRTAPGPVARACLVWPEHMPGSLAETAPALIYAAADPRPEDDPDDSIWDESGYGPPDLADESTSDIAPPGVPTTDGVPSGAGPVGGASDGWGVLRADPVRRRRDAVALAAFLLMGVLALGASGLVRWPSPPRRPTRTPRPVALALHAPTAVEAVTPEARAAPSLSPDRERPGPEGVGVVRRTALRPVGPPATPGLARARRAGRRAPAGCPGAGPEPDPVDRPADRQPDDREGPRPCRPGPVDVGPAPDAGPPPAEAARRRGDEHLGRGELDDAVAAYSEAIRLDPGLAEAFAGRGQVFIRRGEAARAIADLDEALRLRPGSAPVLNDRGLAELGLGDVFRAIADLDAALRVAPGSAVIHYNRGVAYSRLGEPDEAITEFDAALRLDPNLAVARAARSRAPARQVALTRGTSWPPRPFVTPSPPIPTSTGIMPTPQDPLRSGETSRHRRRPHSSLDNPRRVGSARHPTDRRDSSPSWGPHGGAHEDRGSGRSGITCPDPRRTPSPPSARPRRRASRWGT